MKKYILLALILTQFGFLSAQKGVFEIGLHGGRNISYPVNFTENRYHWAIKPLSSFQFGLSFGYRFNEFYTFRTGVHIERRGFRDSTYLSGTSNVFPATMEYIRGYISIPLLNEFHFLNHHLIACVGVDFAKNYYKRGNEFGVIAGLGTRFNITKRIKWRLDAKFNRGLKDWRFRDDYFYLDGLKTLNISTGLIYAFEKKKK